MKKGIIIGGSNGIGLALVNNLLKQDYFVYIFDKEKPSSENLINDNYEYIKCNLLDFDDELFANYSNNMDINLLIITAGFGRVMKFKYLHQSEIQNIMQVNCISIMKIIHHFYHRINNTNTFYCGIMGSIAGLISSPLFSVYSASKGALHRFIESLNIELEMNNINNRITNISPGSIKGTRFNGGQNNLEETQILAQEIIDNIFLRNTLFIPQYANIYQNVIQNYLTDSHKFGLESYKYKEKSGRIIEKSTVCIGYLSGTFDLFHLGHLNLLKKAKEQCDYLIVGVHPDASHKGKQTFIPFDERMKIVAGCRYVDKVVQSCKEDSDAWKIYHYNKLFVGSDYKGTERFIKYEQYFKDKNVEIIYFDYTKGTSSSLIRQKIIEDTLKNL